jgi:hypothetical protein
VSEIDKRVRRIGLPWRIAIVVVACLALLVPVVGAIAASPDPSSSGPLATSSTATSKPAASGDTDHKGNDLKPGANVDRLRQFANDFLKGGGFGQGQGHGAVTITAIDGTKLSLKTDDGWTRTIDVTTDTTIMKAGQKIALGDLKVGDTIGFRQKKNADGSYTIVAINVPTPTAAGEITAVGADSLTIKLRDGTSKTITLTGTTKFTLGGKAGAKSDATVGTRIEVQGSTSGTTFTAITVHVNLANVAGEVTAKGANTLTIKGRDGKTITIHVSSTTTFFGKGKAKAATLADIVVGDRVGVSGTKRADGSIDAVGVIGRSAKDLKPTTPVKPQKPTSSAPTG